MTVLIDDPTQPLTERKHALEQKARELETAVETRSWTNEWYSNRAEKVLEELRESDLLLDGVYHLRRVMFLLGRPQEEWPLRPTTELDAEGHPSANREGKVSCQFFIELALSGNGRVGYRKEAATSGASFSTHTVAEVVVEIEEGKVEEAILELRKEISE